MKKNAIGLAALVTLTVFCLSTAWGQDFQKNYSLPPGGTISVSNVSGDVSVTGYNGLSVAVSAYREGRDKDQVQIIDESTSTHVALKVQYPQGGGSVQADVRFVVQVPQGSSYQFDKISTASGDISIAGVAGDFKINTASGDVKINQVEGNVQANTASGDMEITRVHGSVQANAASGDVRVLDAAGMVSARTASGDVDVELTRIEGTGELKFASASGDVTVKAPAQFDAQVELTTANGSIKTDFPLTIEDLENHGKKAHGQLGSGAVQMKVSTASGDIRLVRQ